jgi:hypothetical protein
MPRKIFEDTPEGRREEFSFRLKQLFRSNDKRGLRFKYDALMRWAFLNGLLSESEYKAGPTRVPSESKEAAVSAPIVEPTRQEPDNPQEPNGFLDDITKRGK